MRLITISIVVAVVIIAAAAAIALLGLGGPRPPPPQTVTTTQPSPAQTATQPSIKFDQQLAQQGLNYFKQLGCVSCHTIKSLGVSGGAVGPELSRSLVSPSQGGALARFYGENGLANPASDPDKAAQLLAKFLAGPPGYTNAAMSGFVNSLKQQYGADWEAKYVPALVEMLKWAASK